MVIEYSSPLKDLASIL